MAAMTTQQASWVRSVAIHSAIFIFACIMVIARRPDAVFHAQFYAEDGRYWFANAYNLGWWHALLVTRGGYLQTFPRLGAAIALLVPFSIAPLVLNLIAIAVQAIPVNILLSARSAEWGNLRFRAVLAAFYLALPNTLEISAGITESQWILALCAFLLLVALRPASRLAKVFDLTICTLSGLTGPFCLLLLPIATFLMRKRRSSILPVAVFAAASLIQAIELLAHPGSRGTAPLGASLEGFIRILAGHIYLGTILGANGTASKSAHHLVLFFACVVTLCTALIRRCFKEAPANMRIFLLFAAAIFMASLASSLLQPVPGKTVWQLLASGSSGCHYWFLPTLAFAWSLLWCALDRSRAVRLISRALLFLMCIGLFRDWRHPAFTDMSFATYARDFESAPSGTIAIIPINPTGWHMQLSKH